MLARRNTTAFDLKGAREMRGLSQIGAAAILCTTQPTVSRWESEGNTPAVYQKVWTLHWQLEKLSSKGK